MPKCVYIGCNTISPKRLCPEHSGGKGVEVAGKSSGEVMPEPRSSTPATVKQERARKGGKARASKLTAKQRSEIARKAAKARWGK